MLFVGFIVDLTGEYGTPFLTHGSVTILGGVLMAIIPFLKSPFCTGKKRTVIQNAPPVDDEAVHEKCLTDVHSTL